MSLVRQMYPGDAQRLLRRFEDADRLPYGYLLIDLKPTTPEASRMRTNVLEELVPSQAGTGVPSDTFDERYRTLDRLSDESVTSRERQPVIDTFPLQEHFSTSPDVFDIAAENSDENRSDSEDDDLSDRDDSGGEAVSFNPEIEKWRRHFQRMAEGKVQSNHKGHYIVEDLPNREIYGRRCGNGSVKRTIDWVTPIAQDIEMARSLGKRRRPNSNGNDARTNRKHPDSNDYFMRPPGIQNY